MTILVCIAIGLIIMFIPLIIEQGQNLSLLNIQELQNNVENLYIEVINYFELNQIYVEQSIKKSDLLSKINYALIPNLLNSVVSGFLFHFSF